MAAKREGRIFFYIVMFLVGWATFTLVRDYMGAIVFAVVVAIVFRPIYDAIDRRVGGRTGIATALTMLSMFAAVLIPLSIIFLLTVDQLQVVSEDLADLSGSQRQLLDGRIQELRQLLTDIPLADRLNINEAEISQKAQDLVAQGRVLIRDRLLAAGASTFDLFSLGIVFLITVGALLSNHNRLVQLLRDLSPMDDALDQLFLDRFAAMAKAMTKGIIVIAIVQGVVAGILMAVSGTAYVLPLTILAIFAAVMPLGVAILTVPVGSVRIFIGDTWQGALIIAGSLLFVSSLDNWLRPKLVSKEAYLNPALVLLSAFGGISLFGFLGVVYGPIIMILFVTTIDVYLAYYRDGAPQAIAEPSVEES